MPKKGRIENRVQQPGIGIRACALMPCKASTMELAGNRGQDELFLSAPAGLSMSSRKRLDRMEARDR